MNYQPTPADAALDLNRCVLASFSDSGLNDPNVAVFLSHAEKILSQTRGQIDPKLYGQIQIRLQKAQLKANPVNKRREDLLMAATLLQNWNQWISST